MGSRVLLSRGLSCEGWLLLLLILSALGIFDGTIMNMAEGKETSNQGPHRDDAGPSSIKESPPDDLISNTSRELSTSLEGHASSSRPLIALFPSS